MEEKTVLEQSVPEQTQQKRTGLIKKVTCGAVVLVLAGGIGVSIGMSGMNYHMTNQIMGQINKQNDSVNEFISEQRELQAKEQEQENTYQEDGFKIMDQYEIRSTKQISDAYLKGDPSGLNEEDKETYDMASDVLKKIIRTDMSTYEKELAIYDWMIDNIGHSGGHVIAMPGQGRESYTPHDVLKNLNAVCVGYATTFRLLANMEGMDVHIVHNDYHSWDMVKLDDGEWYQLDIYSDNSSGTRYRNFNMTDAVARNGHDWDGSSLPAANGIKYSYAMQNAVPVKDLYEIPAKVKEGLENKMGSLYFKFPKKLTDDEMSLADQMMSLFTQALYSLPDAGSKEISGAWLPDGKDCYLLAVYINDYAGTAVNNVKPEDSRKMTAAINQAFGVELVDPNAGAAVDPGTNSGIDVGVDEKGNQIKIESDDSNSAAGLQVEMVTEEAVQAQ